MKRLLLVVGVVVLLGGCGTTVPLAGNGAPVENRSTSDAADTAGTRGAGGADAKGVGQGSVTQVQLSSNGASGSDAALASVQTRTIYFDYDSYTIRAEFQSVLEAHARALKADSTRKVQIEGHTDSRGGREYNLSLGQRRAEAVRRALAVLGVRDTQMEAVSFGKEKPAVVEDSEEAMQKNRRVELNYQ